MILVKVAFDGDTDLHAAMENLVKDIDANYNTIADANHRAIVGTGVGGYLAYILGLTEKASVAEETAVYKTLSAPKLFKYVASTRGDFVSENNKWYETYGDVYGYLESMGSSTLSGFYTYLDAPVKDTWTNLKYSSNDIGYLGIEQGLSADVHEFTVRPGKYTGEFQTESVNRISDRFTQGILDGVVEGKVSLTKIALTANDKDAEVNYTVTVKDLINQMASGKAAMKVTVSLVDPSTKNVLTSVSEDVSVDGAKDYTGKMKVENLVNGTSSTVQLSVELLNATANLASTSLVRVQDMVVEGDNQKIDLTGDWYFNYTGSTVLDIPNTDAKEFESWSVVQPAQPKDIKWHNGYGNFKDDTVSVPAWAAYYGIGYSYFTTGSGYYARTFVIPEEFDSKDIILSIGYVDDRCEVFFNGVRVGGNGIGEDGKSTGEKTWSVFNYFSIDPSLVNYNGENTVVVRAYNDGPYGEGGWYDGPIGLYSKEAFENMNVTGQTRFVEEAFDSEYAAKALGKEGTVENKYLVYLPEGYDKSDRYYPTVYLFHQWNSTHTSYITDRVDVILDESVKSGLFDEMIVVVPNSDGNSWWTGDWKNMITKELIPLIDAKYRTIDDARYRITAGCSMGGQGAYGVALTSPDYFSGAISFFGGLSMAPTEAEDALKIATNESVDYLNNFALYFICGNQDFYGFGKPAIELNQILESKGIEHYFFIENGEHNSAFYVPYFDDAFAYIRDNMYKSDEAVEKLLSGEIIERDGKLYAAFEGLAGINEYYNAIPSSTYTVNQNPDLNIPLTVEITQNGKVVYETTIRTNDINDGDTVKEYELTGAEAVVDVDDEYSVVYKAAIFDRVVELGVEDLDEDDNGMNGEIGGNTDTDTDTNTDIDIDSDTDTVKTDSVKTGDESPVMMYAAVAVMALAVAVIVIKKKRA